MGVYKRGKVYYMDFVVDGERVNRSTGKRTKREAKAVEGKVKLKLMQEQEERYVFSSKIFPKMPTLMEAGQQLYEDKWSKNKRGHQPLRMIEVITDDFENPLMNEIDKQWLYRLTKWLSKTRKVATVNRHLASMRTILLWSRDQWEILDRVPKITLSQENNQRTRTVTYDEQDEMTALLRANTVKLRPYDPAVADLIDFLCDTGLRLSEALNLEPKNLVRDDYVLLYPLDTKSKKVRTVPLTSTAKRILQERGKAPFEGLDKWKAQRSFVWAKKQIEVTDPEFCVHSCRHTYASRLLQTGKVGLYEVKELLGHASITTTQRYSHLAVRHLEKAVSYLERI